MEADQPTEWTGRRTLLVNRYVVAAFLLQTLSYAILLGFFEHDQVTPLVGLLRGLPTVLAAVFGVFAIPALAVTVALGAAAEFVFGVSFRSLGTGLVSGNDLPFLVVAYLLSVGAGRFLTRRRERARTGDSES